MKIYILLVALTRYALAVPYQVHEAPATEAKQINTKCCDCHFEDTKYISTPCSSYSPFMTLVQNVVSLTCDIADPCRRLGRDDVPHEEWFDFIIVGAGVAGPVIARRLSDVPWWKVLLIEAGPEEPSMSAIPGLAFNGINSSLDWNYSTEPTQPHPTACLEKGGRCVWPRGRMVAGTAGLYGMMYARGHPEIYNSWSRAGNTGWSYDEIAHYFERAENPVHPKIVSDRPRTVHPGGPMKIQYYPHKPAFAEELLKAAGELGYKTSLLKEYAQTGFMVAPMTVENGLRGTTSRAYLRPAHARTNLRVVTNAHVTRVLTNPWDGKAYGVELVDKQGFKRVVRCIKEVVLTAGAIGSPQILLNSGIGPREELAEVGVKVVRDLPVGRNLHNHVSVGIQLSIRDTSYETMTMDAVNQYLHNRTGALASTGLTQVTAFLESSYAANGVPDLQVFFDGFSSTCPKTGMNDECTYGPMHVCPDRRQIVARPTVVYVETRGTMRLRSANPLDRPLLYPNYFSDTKDLEVLTEGIKKVLQLINTPTMQRHDLRLEETVHPLCARYHFGTDAYWKCLIRAATGPENHQSGSCKMGPNGDPTAVVDPQLRVHGIPNIRVADASIFPTVPNANPIAGIIMVAEKAADMIAKTWPTK
ncbi:hypothetical protein KM043_005262 [Ampulex compressa]|nr:hypothetical protein KM043_005262 [Ampulex compressa]